MFNLQEARERRNVRAGEARKLLDEHPAGKWGADQQAEFDRLENEIGSIDQTISNHQKLMDAEAGKIFDGNSTEHSKKLARDLPENDPLRIFDIWTREGERAITAEQWQVIRNTMSTTTGSEGGYNVPSLIASQLIDYMKAYGTMRKVADVLQTADGKPLSYPTTDGTAEVGEWIAQNTTATAADPVFGTVSLNVFKASSKIVAAPVELLQDSTIDMEAFIMKRLGQRLGRIANTGYTIGTGTTQPDGVVPKAGSGKVGTTGQTLTIIFDDLIDLVHSVDPAYRGPNASFMTNDSLLKVLRKLKDTTGRPLWTPSWDGGIQVGTNQSGSNNGNGGFSSQNTPVVFDYLLGYPVWVNNDIAVPAANAKTLLFGDFSYYKIRDAMDVTMFRFTDSAYAKLGQVGFLAWLRTGGNLIDVNAVKFYQHSAT